MITPTVGRIVHFYAKLIDGSPASASPPQAAIVTNVWNDRRVNLTVFGHDGSSNPITSVRLQQPGDEADGNAYCCWMPYQVKKSTGSESGEAAAGVESV